MHGLKERIQTWGKELGFQQLGVADTQLEQHEQHLQRWLASQFHGEMNYMERHGTRRSRPGELVPGTIRVISARMDYLNESAISAGDLMQQSGKALISRYALGRDYHKLMHRRLQRLASRVENEAGPVVSTSLALILAREFASSLATPMFVADERGE